MTSWLVSYLALVVIFDVIGWVDTASYPPMSSREFSQLLARRPTPRPPSGNDGAKRPHEPNNEEDRPPIVIVPGYEGTILSRRYRRILPSWVSRWLSIRPGKSSTSVCGSSIYRSPLVFGSVRCWVNQSAKDIMIPTDVKWIDYPNASCLSGEFSHVGHCHPWPTKGPIQNMIDRLETEIGYRRDIDIHGIGYDWSSSFAEMRENVALGLDSRLSATSPAAIVLAHGLGCSIAASVIQDRIRSEKWSRKYTIRAFVCVAGDFRPIDKVSSLTRDSASLRSRYYGPFENTDIHDRLSLTHIEHHMGLRRGRRSNVPVQSGPWDIVNPKRAAPSLLVREGQRLSQEIPPHQQTLSNLV